MKSSTLFNIPSWFVVLRHNAQRIPVMGGYDRYQGQVNPFITKKFFHFFSNNQVIWDPFAGIGKSFTIDIGLEKGLCVLAQDIGATDNRVRRVNSMTNGPGQRINGIIFHPPYYGTGVFTNDKNDIGLFQLPEDYISGLRKVVELGLEKLEEGYVCVVGSSYLLRGKRVYLDWWLTALFMEYGLQVVEMWSSEPDIGVILRRQK